MYLLLARELRLICSLFILNLVEICSFRVTSAVRLGEPKEGPEGGQVSKSRLVLLRGPLSPYSPGIYRCCPTYLHPLGQRPWALRTAIWAPPDALCAPPDALLCIWRTSRCTCVHLAMPFGHLELPGGVPRGPYDMSELPIENPGEYGDSSSINGTS